MNVSQGSGRPTRGLRVAIISLYALENNGVRHVASSLREEGFPVTEIYFKDWVNNRFPWPEEREVVDLIQLLRDREIDVVGFSVRASAFHRMAKYLTERVRAALDKVGLLNKEKLNPIMLSGGEQQRVGIARAVVNKPPLLLADEPTGNLDPALSAEIMDLFHDFARVGVAVLIATHDLSLIARHRHRLLTLREGRLIHDGEDDDHGA